MNTCWVLLVGTPNGASPPFSVSADAVRALLEAHDELRRFDPGMVLSGQGISAKADAAELRFGRALAGFFPRDQWEWIASRVAEGRANGGAVLAVEAYTSAARSLPWELITDGAGPKAMSFLTLGGLNVVRLHPSDAPLERIWASRLRVVLHTPDPQDSVVCEAGELIRARLKRGSAGILDEVEIVAHEDRAPQEGSVAELLCLVAHGVVREDGQLRIQTAHGDTSVEAFSASLAERMRRSVAVVLLVCWGGAPTQDDNLAAHLLRAGAPAVFAAQAELSAEHGVRLVTKLAERLIAGDNLLVALRHARAHVAELYLAALQSRRWLTSLCVSDVTAPGRRLLAVTLPKLVFRCGPTLRRLFVGALELLRDEPFLGGYVGVELLLLALAKDKALHTDPALSALARVGLNNQDTLRGYLTKFRCPADALPTTPAGVAPPLTPRLERILRELPEDAEPVHLRRRLLEARFFLLRDLHALLSLDESWGNTRGSLSPCAREQFIDRLPSTLEVIGGPEDGRRFTMPRVATALARPDRRASSAEDTTPKFMLYEGTPVYDSSLKKRAPFVMVEPGGQLRKLGVSTELTEVSQGSVVQVSTLTWIGFW